MLAYNRSIRRLMLATLATVALSACAGVTPINDLMANPGRYDGKTVRVEGTVKGAAGALGVRLAVAGDVRAALGDAGALRAADLSGGAGVARRALGALVRVSRVGLGAGAAALRAIVVDVARGRALAGAGVGDAHVGREALAGVGVRASDALLRRRIADLVHRIAGSAVLVHRAGEGRRAVAVGGAGLPLVDSVAPARALLAFGAAGAGGGIAGDAAMLGDQARRAPLGACATLGVGVAVVQQADAGLVFCQLVGPIAVLVDAAIAGDDVARGAGAEQGGQRTQKGHEGQLVHRWGLGSHGQGSPGC